MIISEIKPNGVGWSWRVVWTYQDRLPTNKLARKGYVQTDERGFGLYAEGVELVAPDKFTTNGFSPDDKHGGSALSSKIRRKMHDLAAPKGKPRAVKVRGLVPIDGTRLLSNA